LDVRRDQIRKLKMTGPCDAIETLTTGISRQQFLANARAADVREKLRLFARRLALLVAVTIIVPLTGCATSTHLGAYELKRLPGRTYVIVGASSGFGKGVALRLGRERANVVLAARRTELLEAIAADIRASGGNALVVTTDAGKAEDVDALANAAVDRFGGIDVWMNVAGVGAIGKFWEIPDQDYSRLIDTNVKGVIYGSRAALVQFMAQGRGTLVNVGSIDSEVPLAYQAVYAASKASVLSLARSVNQEIRHAGYAKTIKISTIMPWAADTPWWPHAANYSGRAPRMALMDPPEKVVEAMIWASIHPREELPVGWKAQASYSMHHLLPDLTERVSANIQRAELEKATPAPNTSGALFAPMARGTDVDGGIRARMKAEDAEREQPPR
jgi:short-subunit dehydrogenase